MFEEGLEPVVHTLGLGQWYTRPRSYGETVLIIGWVGDTLRTDCANLRIGDYSLQWANLPLLTKVGNPRIFLDGGCLRGPAKIFARAGEIPVEMIGNNGLRDDHVPERLRRFRGEHSDFGARLILSKIGLFSWRQYNSESRSAVALSHRRVVAAFWRDGDYHAAAHDVGDPSRSLGPERMRARERLSRCRLTIARPNP